MIVRDPAVAGGERTKILDFGIAKLRESVPTKATNTHKDLLMGTPSYMSPEQCRGAGGVDEKTDVYSLGVVLYRALAGRPPFVAPGAGDTMAQHIYQDPPPLAEKAPWLPGSLTALVHRMLGKDKDSRPSMAEVAASLAQLGEELASFVLPDFAEEPSQSGAVVAEEAADDLSGPSQTDGEEGEDEEDEVLDTIAVSESAQSLSPLLGDGALSSNSQSAPSLLGWSVSNTGQGQTAPRLGGRWLAPVAALSLVVLGGGILVARFVYSPAASVRPASSPVTAPPVADPLASRPAQPAAPTAAPSPVSWTVESTPAGADVVRVSDGQLLGHTPWHTEVPAAQGAEELRLRLPGHFEHLVSLPRGASSHSRITLLPVASPQAAAPSPEKLPEKKSPLPGKNSSKNPKRGHVKIVLED